MIDDRQLLRLSRNLASVIILSIGILAIVSSIAAVGTWIEYLAFNSEIPGMLLAAVLQAAIGLALILRRNWIARWLIKPAPADTCPQCDYPIAPAASKCPECGLELSDADQA